MAIHKLILHPSQADVPRIEEATLVATLQEIALIAAPLCDGPALGYRAGERFLQLVTFLGCSPSIELDPPADRGECERAGASGLLCHIRIVAPQEIHFRADGGLPAPRCPRCRRNEPDWPFLIEQWRAEPRHNGWECGACGYRGRLYDLNFRRRGAFGRTFIDIWGIHPAEAVPGETLLETLGKLGGGDWNYIYLQD